MVEVHIDFESRNPLVGPSDVGLHNYIFSPETEPLFLWYKIGEGEYKRVSFYLGEIIEQSSELHMALMNPNVAFVAFNSAFERYMFQKLNYIIPASRFIDPQVGGRYLSLPASLEVQGKVLGLPPSLAKQEGDLVQFFCKHQIVKATKKREGRAYYNDWNSHPKEWAEFLEYGRQDVVAEGELLRRMRILGALPLPEFEQQVWILDQKINDRGMPVDVEFVRKMYNLGLRAKAEAKKNFEDFTGVKNANSPAQVKAWAKPQGYPFDTLKKDTVASVLKDPEIKLTDACRAALKMRAEAASTSYQKLGKILECVSSDGRVHGQFIFMGSSRCGRWSGNAVQLHNFARPTLVGGYDFEDQKVVKEAREFIYREDYDGIKQKYGSVLLVVKSLIRTVFVAP